MSLRIMLVALPAFSLVVFFFGSTAVTQAALTPEVTARQLEQRPAVQIAQAKMPMGAVSEEEKQAHHLEQKLTRDIAGAIAKGADASAAQMHKTEGDRALRRGDSATAMQHYEAAEKALPGK